MFTGSAEAVKKIIGVCLRELSGITELGRVIVNVVVLLDCLNNVALAFKLEELLSHHDVGVVDGYHEVTKITLDLVQVGWVAEGTLVIGDGPLGSSHDAKVAVSVRVDTADESGLGERGSLNYIISKEYESIQVCY